MYTLIGYSQKKHFSTWIVLDTFETLDSANDYLLSPYIENDKRSYYSQFSICEHEEPLDKMMDINEMVTFDNGITAQYDSGKYKGYQKGSFYG